MHKLFKYFLATLLLCMAGAAHAQSLNDLGSIRLVASPQVPGPNTPVRLEVQGVGNTIGDANIAWSQDGKVVKSGAGERVYTFTTGNVGTVTRIRVTVESATIGTITRDATFAPAQVYLVWEANTSVPPLYKGKALYSPGSNVTVTAFPQVVVGGSTLSPNNLSFTWTRNGTLANTQSGKGRNTFSFKGDQLKNGESISVEVSFGDIVVAEGSVFIPATNPALVLYERDPLRGVVFDQALPSAISLTGREVTVQAVPYFFSTQSLSDGSLTYTWTLNNEPASGPDAPQGILTLRQSGEGAGEAALGVSLQNSDPTKLLQAAEAAVRIVFGAESSNSSLFGI